MSGGSVVVEEGAWRMNNEVCCSVDLDCFDVVVDPV